MKFAGTTAPFAKEKQPDVMYADPEWVEGDEEPAEFSICWLSYRTKSTESGWLTWLRREWKVAKKTFLDFSGRVGVCFNERAYSESLESCFQSNSSNSFLWKPTHRLVTVVIQTWSWCSQPAAIARAGLWEANAERWHFIFPYEFGMSHYQYVEESQI
jgi:hypothetical protein